MSQDTPMDNPVMGEGDVLLHTSLPCLIHPTHQPHPHVNHLHHVWPRGDGGPNIEANRVVVCPTGHYNIHHLLERFKASHGHLHGEALHGYGPQEVDLAQLGWARIQRHAM